MCLAGRRAGPRLARLRELGKAAVSGRGACWCAAGVAPCLLGREGPADAAHRRSCCSSGMPAPAPSAGGTATTTCDRSMPRGGRSQQPWRTCSQRSIRPGSRPRRPSAACRPSFLLPSGCSCPSASTRCSASTRAPETRRPAHALFDARRTVRRAWRAARAGSSPTSWRTRTAVMPARGDRRPARRACGSSPSPATGPCRRRTCRVPSAGPRRACGGPFLGWRDTTLG